MLTHPIKIRKATLDDVQDITPLIAELFHVIDHPPRDSFDHVVENYRTIMKDSSHHILLAFIGEEVVGLIHFFIRPTLIHTGPSALIDELVVAKTHHGRGIGSQLISKVVDMCRDFGCEELEVGTETSNTKARKFYRQCGFDREAVLLEMEIED